MSVFSAAFLKNAVRLAIQDTKTMRLPRATSVERIFRPLVKQIQENHNSDMPREFFPLSCDLVVLDLSLNFTMFVTGNMERYPGMSEKETKLVTFFEALTRDELRETEVMQMARRLIGPLLETAIREYLKKKQRFKRTREGEASDVPPLSKRPRNTCTTIGAATQEVHTTYSTNVHLPMTVNPQQLHRPGYSSFPAPRNSLGTSSPGSVELRPVTIAVLSSSQKSSTTLASGSRSPGLSVSRSPNVPLTPSPPISSSTYLALNKIPSSSSSISRKSSLANKENVPPHGHLRR